MLYSLAGIQDDLHVSIQEKKGRYTYRVLIKASLYHSYHTVSLVPQYQHFILPM